MFCPKCGTQNSEGAAFCARCGSPLQGAASSPQRQAPRPQQDGAQRYSRQAYAQPAPAHQQFARGRGAQAAAFGANVAQNIEANRDTIHKVLAAIAVLVLVFMPLGWITIDPTSVGASEYGVGKIHLTIMGMANLMSVSDSVGAGTPIAGDLSRYSTGFGFLAFLWYLGVIALVITAITQLAGINRRNQIGIVGFGLSFVTTLVTLIIVARVRGEIKDAAGQYASQYSDMINNMISGTPWLWIAFIASIVGIAFSMFFMLKKSK